MIVRATAWKTNAEMIRDAVVPLGYLADDFVTYDPTYGSGGFWKLWRPRPGFLWFSDKNPEVATDVIPVDFTAMPWPDRHFDAVVFDPPYKLNGTPGHPSDERYGVHNKMRWQDRMQLIRDGLTECIRVSNRYVLLKCQDQVCSGAVRWQTDEFTRHAETLGAKKVDRFDKLGGIAQPGDRRQVHVHANYSTLLVFQVS